MYICFYKTVTALCIACLSWCSLSAQNPGFLFKLQLPTSASVCPGNPHVFKAVLAPQSTNTASLQVACISWLEKGGAVLHQGKLVKE